MAKKQKKDTMLDICVEQGYVPETCQLDGQLVYMLTKENGDACKGCNIDRAVCKGRHG